MTAVSLDNTRLPRQIRERLERGAAIIAESQRASDGSTEQPIEAAQPQPGAAAATPTPAPAVAATTNPNDSTAAEQPDLKPFRDPALATDPRAEDPVYWRQRLSVMQGKLNEERREHEGREAALKTKISELESQIRDLKASAPAAPVDLKAMFSPEQIEALGEDQAAAIATAAVKAARQHVDQALTEQQTTAQQRQEQIAEETRQRRWREFIDQLEEVVPDWKTIDARTDWREWLGGIDERTAQVRQELLNAALHSYNVAATAAVFGAFLKTLSPRAQPPVTTPSDAGKPAAPPQPSAGDRSQMAPTEAEMKDYYKRASLGKVSDAERVEFEKRLALL